MKSVKVEGNINYYFLSKPKLETQNDIIHQIYTVQLNFLSHYKKGQESTTIKSDD